MSLLTTQDLIKKYNCVVASGQSVRDNDFDGVAPLQFADNSKISFLTNEKYLDEAKKSEAGAILCADAHAKDLVGQTSALIFVCAEPYVTFARISQHYFKPQHPFSGQAQQAFVDQSAEVHPSAVISPFVFIGPGAHIGPESVLYPGVFVGAGSTVGANCILYPNSVVREGCRLGDRCILNPGAVVGGDGFGFAPSGMENVKIPQIGGVTVGNDVELGANATIDRGTLSDTIIEKQTKIDNLVQIAHNVHVGEACFIASQSGIAGSTNIGKRVTLAGQVGVVGHIQIADYVTVLAQAGISKSITTTGGYYFGTPAMPNKDYLKHHATLARMVKKFNEKLPKVNEKE